MVIEKNGFTFVTTKGFKPFEIKETGYKLMSKKLLYTTTKTCMFFHLFMTLGQKVSYGKCYGQHH